MGGMTTLEYPLNTPKGYVRHIIPLATSARHSAWCISWGEAQRQSIYSDPAYDDGYYCYSDDEDEDGLNGETEEERKRRIEERQPTRGLAAARMAALLTYRSRDSFESRFGRKYGAPVRRGRGGALSSGGGEGGRRRAGSGAGSGTVTPREDNLRAHNDGHRARKDSTGSSKAATPVLEKALDQLQVPLSTVVDQQDPSRAVGEGPGLTNLELSMPGGSRSRTPAQQEGKVGTGASRQVFSAQSYLRYQGDKVSLAYGLTPRCSSGLTTIAAAVHRAVRCQLLHPHHPQNGHARHLVPVLFRLGPDDPLTSAASSRSRTYRGRTDVRTRPCTLALAPGTGHGHRIGRPLYDEGTTRDCQIDPAFRARHHPLARRTRWVPPRVRGDQLSYPAMAPCQATRGVRTPALDRRRGAGWGRVRGQEGELVRRGRSGYHQVVDGGGLGT